MTASPKNKTLASLLAITLGSLGAHRFYLHGWRDKLGWLHFSSLPVSALIASIFFGWPGLFSYGLLILSFLIALLCGLVFGLTADEKWDAQYNPGAPGYSDSGWLLALLLVLATGVGAIALIGVLARSFDLLYTGGAYG